MPLQLNKSTAQRLTSIGEEKKSSKVLEDLARNLQLEKPAKESRLNHALRQY